MKKDDTIRLTLDPDHLPPLGDAQKQRLDTVALMPHARIDYSDAPFRPDAVWQKNVRVPPIKRQITLRIDADFIDFFQHMGRRYQTRINAVLRSYMDATKQVS